MSALRHWGISRVQETTVGRAVGAVLSVTLGLVCCFCGLGGVGVAALLFQR